MSDLGSSPVVKKRRGTTPDVASRAQPAAGGNDVISGTNNDNKRKNSGTTNGSSSSESKYPRLVPIPVAGPSSKPNKFFKTRNQNCAKMDEDGWIWVDVGSGSPPRGSSSPGAEIIDKKEMDRRKRKEDSDESFHSVTSDVTYDSDSSASDTSKRSTTKTTRKPQWLRYYSKEEGQKILDVICKHGLFLYTGGNKLWNTLEKANFLKDRTSQSMRNHYLKTVLVKVLKGKVYSISAEDAQLLKKAQTDALETRHANFCPDFDPTDV